MKAVTDPIAPNIFYTHFILDGTKVVAQYETDYYSSTPQGIIYFYYDESGSPTGMKYNGNVYFFQKNLQGDIIRILNSYGSIVATYTYDAWGNIIASTDTSGVSIGTKNPFRYRGYYFDTETGLYYLQSRYYDPQVGRFINADDALFIDATGTLLGCNLYAYCENDVINLIDSQGFIPEKRFSGIVGFGIQILLSIDILWYQAIVGVEALWFAYTKNNNFGNGFIPWCYAFYGGARGLTIDFDDLLSPNLLKNPKNLFKGMGLSFSVSIDITVFLVTAKNMKTPDDYTRDFSFNSATIWGVTVSKAWGSNISTYGVGVSYEVGISPRKFSFGKRLFGISSGGSYYFMIPIGKNAKGLYNLVKGRI